MGRPAREGESPVSDTMDTSWDENLSTARPEKPCRKLGRPRSKAKYDAATDRAKYREGKAKRTPVRGVK
jgi:hypothetical protein